MVANLNKRFIINRAGRGGDIPYIQVLADFKKYLLEFLKK